MSMLNNMNINSEIKELTDQSKQSSQPIEEKEKKKPSFIKFHSQKDICLHISKPKPKPKQTCITPTPLILCTLPKFETNPFSLDCHDDLNKKDDLDKKEDEDEDDEAKDDSEGDDENDCISALPKTNLKQHTRNDPFRRKESKDAEEILVKKKSGKLNWKKDKGKGEDKDKDYGIGMSIDDDDINNNLNMRNTINICPGQKMIGYSILNYLEMTCGDNSPMRRTTLNNKVKQGTVNN